MTKEENAMKIKPDSPIKFSMTALIAILFLTAGAAMAQSDEASRARSVNPISNSPTGALCAPDKTFTYSSGAHHFSFCFDSEHAQGSLLFLISPAGLYQISGREGYIVCGTGAANAYAILSDDMGWEEAVISQPGGPNTLPITFTRQSTDGKFELAQTFDWDPVEKEILITMTLKNISAASITSVRLSRYFRGLPGADVGDDVYDRDSDSVWGVDLGGSGTGHHGLMLSALTFTQTHTAFVEKYADWNPFSAGAQTAHKCTAIAQAVPTPAGDYVGRVTYALGTLSAGASKTVQFVYRRF